MRHLATHRDFTRWRTLARDLLVAEVPPTEVLWTEEQEESLLPNVSAEPSDAGENPLAVIIIPRAFLNLAAIAGCHREADRWNLLYRVAWRLTHGEKSLLERVTDDDTYRLLAMERAVRRDRHKMTAFVRFRSVRQGELEHFVAWHRPDHFIVRLTAPFFASRFAALAWTILTPDDSVMWDGSKLQFSAGVSVAEAPHADDLESFWKTYYANIFNPARIKIDAMKRELPVRHWPTLPEAALIPDLLLKAPERVKEMIRKARQAAKPSGRTPVNESQELFAAAVSPDASPQGSTIAWGAQRFIPQSRSLTVLSAAAKTCRGCDLCDVGTQTVFGEGPPDAEVVFVGEQPGDQEDLAGRPFVGPAGQLLNEVLEKVGIHRDRCYVTNTVKHFKWEPRGKRRIHSKANAREISACLPWLEAEVEAIKPRMLICLGSTAAQAVLGRDFRVTRQHGQPQESKWAPWTMATIHPSALLRIPDAALREKSSEQFEADLRIAAEEMHKPRAAKFAKS